MAKAVIRCSLGRVSQKKPNLTIFETIRSFALSTPGILVAINIVKPAVIFNSNFDHAVSEFFRIYAVF